MTESTHPVAELTNDDVQALLRRALWITLILGLVASAAVWIGAGWHNAAMLAVGTLISGGSILEWGRLIRFMNAKMDAQQAPRGAALSAVLFVFRLMIFGAAIYGSLKCFRGSVVALLCGLGLAVLAMLWEAMRLLRN